MKYSYKIVLFQTGRCSQGYVREEEVVRDIFSHLDKLRFDDDTLDVVIEATKELSKSEKHQMGSGTFRLGRRDFRVVSY